MEKRVKKALKCAFVDTKKSHDYFARSITLISANTSSDWNRRQFIPFISDWLNFNDKEITTIVATQITALGVKSEGIVFVTPLIGVILCSQNNEAIAEAEKCIRLFNQDKTFPSFLDALTRSPYDEVRCFVPQIIELLDDDSSVQFLLMRLANDDSFCVRRSVLTCLPKLKLEVAKAIAIKMISDPSHKIRGLLSKSCVSFPFWALSLVPKLQNDLAWQVRAATCAQLINCSKKEIALTTAVWLTHDKSWEVKLVALRIMAKILRDNKELRVYEPEKEIKNMITTMRSVQMKSIKDATINAFIELMKKEIKTMNEDQWIPFVDVILTEQKSPIKVHFFKTVADTSFVEIKPYIAEKFRMQIELLSMDRDMNLREEVANELETFSKFFTEPDDVEALRKTAKILISDVSLPIRKPVIEYVADKLLMKNEKTVLEDLEMMGASSKFRERQTSISILEKMYEKTKSQSLKKKIMANISELKSDPVSNVSIMATNFEKENC